MLPDSLKKIILVLSGKGGVGKSTVSLNLALSLRKNGHKVGVLDVDICGPSMPHLLGLEGSSIHQSPAGWVPVYTDSSQSLGVVSIAFLLNSRNDSIIWRGPKKTAMVKQFINDVNWDGFDYLIVDTPPGTSDEHITVMTEMKQACSDGGRSCGAIIVTTPQRVALDDVSKEISLCRKIGVEILGLIENMSGYECPNCKECTNIWSSGGGKSLAEHTSIPFLGTLPIVPKISLENSQTSEIFSNIALLVK